MKALVIPTSLASRLRIVELGKDQLQSFYKIIGCRVIDYVNLGYTPKGLAVDAVVDDEALLQEHPITNQRFCFAYFRQRMQYLLFGTVVVVLSNEDTGKTAKFNLDAVRDLLVLQYGFNPNDFSEENLNANV